MADGDFIPLRAVVDISDGEKKFRDLPKKLADALKAEFPNINSALQNGFAKIKTAAEAEFPNIANALKNGFTSAGKSSQDAGKVMTNSFAQVHASSAATSAGIVNHFGNMDRAILQTGQRLLNQFGGPLGQILSQAVRFFSPFIGAMNQVSNGSNEMAKLSKSAFGIFQSGIAAAFNPANEKAEKLSSVFLGLGVDVDKAMRLPKAGFEEFLAAFRSIPDETERGNLAIQVFGNNAAKLMPVLEQDSAAMAEMGSGASTAAVGLGVAVGAIVLVVAAVAALAFGVVSATTTLFSWTKSIAETNRQLYDNATKTGTSVEMMSAFSLAAGRSHISIDRVASSINILNKHIVDAAEGNKTARSNLERFGVDSNDLAQALDGNLNPALTKIVDKLESSPASALKSASALKDFGKAGADMIIIAHNMGMSVEEYMTQMQALGIIVTKEGAQKSKDFEDSLYSLGNVVTGIQRKVVDEVAPSFTKIIQVFTELLIKAIPTIQIWAKEIGNAMEWVAEQVILMVAVARASWAKLQAGAIIIHDLSQNFSNLGDIVSEVASAVAGGASGIAKALSGDFAGAASDIGMAIGHAHTAMDILKTDVKASMKDISQTMDQYHAQLLIIGMDALRQQRGLKNLFEAPGQIDTVDHTKTKKGKNDPGESNTRAAELAVEKALAEQNAKVDEILLDNRKAALQEHLEDNLVSYRDYYSQVRQMALDSANAEKTKFTEEINSEKTRIDQAKEALADKKLSAGQETALNAEIGNSTAKITELQTKRLDAAHKADKEISKIDRDEIKQKRDLQKSYDDLTATVLESEGKIADAARLRFDAQYKVRLLQDQLIISSKTATAAERQAAEQDIANLNILRQEVEVKGSLSEVDQRLSILGEQRSNVEARIQFLVDNGVITELQGKKALLAAQQQYSIELDKQIPLMEAQLALTDKASPAYDQLRNKIEALRIEQQKLGIDTEKNFELGKLAHQMDLDFDHLNDGVRKFLSEQKSLQHTFEDFRTNTVKTLFDAIDSGVDKLFKGLGAVGSVVGQLIKDLLRLELSRAFQILFGLNGSGGGGFQIGGGNSGGGIGGFFGKLLGIGGGNSSSSPLGGPGTVGGVPGLHFGGGGGAASPSNLLGSAAAGAFSGAGSIASPASLTSSMASEQALNTALHEAGHTTAAVASTSALAGIIPGLAAAAPAVGLSLGSMLGGTSVPGQIAGALGGLALGGTAAAFLAPGIFGTSALGTAAVSLLTNPITIAAGIALLIGAFFLGKSKQRHQDEVARDQIYHEQIEPQLNQLLTQVRSDQTDGPSALVAAQNLKTQYFSAVDQLKTKSVRDSARTIWGPVIDHKIAEIGDAAASQTRRKEISSKLTPEFATGGILGMSPNTIHDYNGRIPGTFDGKDDILFLGSRGETILNPRQVEALGGAPAMKRAKVPGYAGGSAIGAPIITTGRSSSSDDQTITIDQLIIELNNEVVIGEETMTKAYVVGARSKSGRRVIVREVIPQAKRNRELA
jgi:hypothetical protein